jgi:hypothetical protein
MLAGQAEQARKALAQCVALDRSDVLKIDFARAYLCQLERPTEFKVSNSAPSATTVP